MTTSEPEGHARLSDLADTVERRQRDIENRWLAKVVEDARAARVELTDLKDAIGLYIRKIADALRDSQTSSKRPGVDVWLDVASEHAESRVRIGFDVEQLLRELIVLRKTVTAILREEGVLTSGMAVERITEIVDDAIGASLKAYVQARDYQARVQHAQHLGFLAHQVRAPLSAAMLSLTMVRRKLSVEAAQALDRTERNLKRMRDIIEETLLAGSLEANAVEAKPVDTTVGELLEDVLVAFGQAAEGKGLVLRTDYNPKTRVHTDPRLAFSAVEHLLENGIKYTDEGEVSLVVQEQDGRLEFHVHDSGPGLSPQELAVIFEPFRRGRSNKPGSGLGLAIASRAVAALGGEIHVESTEGGGSHFWFTIPGVRQ